MADSLRAYRQKRDFDRTGEPEGRAAAAAGEDAPLRFAVQHHLASRDHFDVRLEWRGTLKSWAVPKGPSFNPADKRLAVQVEDHPLEYCTFEGNIPKGQYGGGAVMLWDEGIWTPAGDAQKGLTAGSLKFTLHGKRLKGSWALVRLKGKEDAKQDNWLLIKEQDGFAQGTDGIARFKTSIATGRTMPQIKRDAPAKTGQAVKKNTVQKNKDGKAGKSGGADVGEPVQRRNPFDKADVQLALHAGALPKDGSWLYELKYDGYRILAFAEGGRVAFTSRNGNDYTRQFGAAAEALNAWANGRAMVLDGEMAVTDAAGRTDFQALQGYLKKPGGKNLVYIVFDVLALDGEDIRQRPLTERKRLLRSLMKNAPAPLHYSAHTEGGGAELLTAVCGMGLEGLVAKKADSPYTGGRNGDWLKIKCDNRREFVIGGFTRTTRNTNGVSALLLGYYEEGALVYAGRAGTGFTDAAARSLAKRFGALTRKTPPFARTPHIGRDETATWLKPALIAEIKFAEWTKEQLLRQASFKGLREDKDAASVVKEPAPSVSSGGGAIKPKRVKRSGEESDGAKHITVAGVTVTNPHKLLFQNPAVSKGEVAAYYMKVAARMLPHVQNRILSLICCPKGVGDACFYKKHLGEGSPGLVPVTVQNSEGKEDVFYALKDVGGMIGQVQMNTVEFHVWGSRADNHDRPDVMMFDLDPDKGMDLKQVRQGVRHLKSVLDALSLTAYLKTSGGKGYHVVVPFTPCASWTVFRAFAKRVAETMEQRWPHLYTANMRMERRKGKIFIDWVRNTRSATGIAPYSVRARTGARVSMPIPWSRLNATAPDAVTMADALKSMSRKDPWAGFFDTAKRQTLEDAEE